MEMRAATTAIFTLYFNSVARLLDNYYFAVDGQFLLLLAFLLAQLATTLIRYNDRTIVMSLLHLLLLL